MSGHSKWASIKHKKAITDSRKGAAYTKLANLIALAARQGGADVEMNFRLRLAVAKAKSANMPAGNIERAIAKGAGTGSGAAMEEIIYEGYGPAGVAVMVEVATDNRNRAAADVRSAFSKYGGRMGESGSVAYQFDHKGVINFESEDVEAAELAAIDAGAEDVAADEGVITVYTAPTELEAVKSRLAESGFEAQSAELQYIPKSTVEIPDAKTAGTIVKLMDALEESDDVVATSANFDIHPEILEQI